MTTTTLALVSDLDRYMAQINKYPVLCAEEEVAIAKRWRDEGDVDAAHTLVTSNLRFVVKIAHEYRGYGAKILDLIQEGSIGLMQAVKRFDPDKGYRLITYAVFWIRSHIHSFLMATTRMFKIGTSRAHRKLFFKLRSLKGKLASSGTTDREEILNTAAEKFSVTRDDIEEMEVHLSGRDTSLDAQISDSGTPMSEIIPAHQLSQEERLANMEETADQNARLQTALNALDPREKEIVTRRHLTDDPAQLKDLGKEFGVSKQRVAQLEQRALKKLKMLLVA